jgi:hypothetical protein
MTFVARSSNTLPRSGFAINARIDTVIFLHRNVTAERAEEKGNRAVDALERVCGAAWCASVLGACVRAFPWLVRMVLADPADIIAD